MPSHLFFPVSRWTGLSAWRRTARALGAFLLLLFASQWAQADAHIRFSNASLQHDPASDKVEIRLDAVVRVSALAYKNSTGYLDVAPGNYAISAWFGVTKLVERRIDLINGMGYAFFVIGDGSESAPYDLHVQFESTARFNQSTIEYTVLMAATYPGHPREDAIPIVLPLYSERFCRTATSIATSGRNFKFPRAGIPPQWGGGLETPARESSGDKAFPERTDVLAGQCSIKLIDQVSPTSPPLAVAPFPPGMSPLGIVYTPQGGSRITQVLVGDGVRAPIEWWIVTQRAYALEPAYAVLGAAAGGIWVAPEYPGVAMHLDVANADSLIVAVEGRLGGILTGPDADGIPRWNLLKSPFALNATRTGFIVSEYMGNSSGAINETAVTETAILSLVFYDCNHASIEVPARISTDFRASALAILQVPQPLSINFVRAAPGPAPCVP